MLQDEDNLRVMPNRDESTWYFGLTFDAYEIKMFGGSVARHGARRLSPWNAIPCRSRGSRRTTSGFSTGLILSSPIGKPLTGCAWAYTWQTIFMQDPNKEVPFVMTRLEAGWILHSIDLYYERCKEAHFDSVIKILDA
jgi:hypothetical protein